LAFVKGFCGFISAAKLRGRTTTIQELGLCIKCVRYFTMAVKIGKKRLINIEEKTPKIHNEPKNT